MKRRPHQSVLLAITGCLLWPLTSEATLPVYNLGHSDLVPYYETEPDRLAINIRFDPNLTFEDGSPIEDFIVDASSVAIRIPDPPFFRGLDEGNPNNPFDDVDRSGPQWNFLGVDVGEYFYSLPQSNTTGFPFMGIASDPLTPASQWSSDLTWSLRSLISAPVVDGVQGEVSVWQQSPFGQPQDVYIQSIDGVDEEEDFFIDSIGGHDHYNWSFSLPGMYQLEVGVNAIHGTAGELDTTTTLTFLVGDSTSQTQPTVQTGDFNGDGAVDLADYTIWRNSLGATEDGSVLAGNGNGGVVDSTDYLDWKAAYGAVYTQNAAVQAVPEPSTLIGMTLGTLLLLGVARRTPEVRVK